MKKIMSVLLITVLILSSVAYATGGPGMVFDNTEILGTQNTVGDIATTNNENITPIDMSMYDQLRIVDYVRDMAYVEGVNAKGEHVRKGFSVRVPVVAGYNSEKLNQVLNKNMVKYVESILQATEGVSNEKQSKMETSSLLNEAATLRLGNGYIVFKLTTWGNRNVTIKYDLATDTLSAVK